MPKKIKNTEENQTIKEVVNEVGYYNMPEETQVENVLDEDAIVEDGLIEEEINNHEKNEMPSPEKIRFFNSVQILAQIVEDMFMQGKLSLKQSHDAYECFQTINALINEI